MIVSGDFTINFADDRSQIQINFLREKLGLIKSNDKNNSITLCGNTLDALFTRS